MRRNAQEQADQMKGRWRSLCKRVIWLGAAASVIVLLLALSPESVSRSHTGTIKIFLLAGAIALAMLWSHIPRRTALAVLLVLALVSTLNYFRWGAQVLFERVDAYDVTHYYLGAKYFDELGYEGLYPALILAFQENDTKVKRLKSYRLQTATGYEYRKVDDALDRARDLRDSKFSPARWAAFRQDALVLFRDFGLSNKSWRRLFRDRGFNASPAWIALARPIVDTIPIGWVKSLCLLDLYLLASGLLAIWFAYGGREALWALVFCATTYSLRWPVVGDVFLRYLWLAGLLWALALLKTGKPAAAGIAVGVAALSRIFPVVWLFGLAAQQLQRLLSRPLSLRNIERTAWLTALGFAGSVAVLGAVSTMMLGGDAFLAHAKDMRIHTDVQQLMARHMGYAMAWVFDGSLEATRLTDAQRADLADLRFLRIGSIVAVLGVLALGMRSLRSDEAFALGFIPLFLMTTFHDYYGVARVTLVIFHATRLDRRLDRVCLAGLLALEMFTIWARLTFPGHVAFRTGYLSWGLTIYALTVTLGLAWEWWRDRRSSRATSAATDAEIA
jgi:hypothetical protein